MFRVRAQYRQMGGSMARRQVEVDPLVERAARLFEYLARVQQLQARPVRRVESYAGDDGAVIWFHQLPTHESVVPAGCAGDPDPDAAILTLDRIPRLDPPLPPAELVPWIGGPTHDPDREPILKDEAVIPAEIGSDEEVATQRPAAVLRIDDHRAVEEQFLSWLEDWDVWARTERQVRPVRDLYHQVFRAHLTHDNAPEEWEAVLGVGLLAWRPEGHEEVLRHCLTQPVVFEFDDDTGRIVVRPSEDGHLGLELDMMDPRLWPDQPRLQDVRARVEGYTGHVLHRDGVGEIARRLTHNLSPEGSYSDLDGPPDPTSSLACNFAPALVLRKRTHQGLIDIFRTIKAQVEERGVVPAGLRILLEPEQAPEVTEVSGPTTGAWVEDGDDVYLPLPVNERQREVIERVDRRATTLVQGPPGTGKTHTAAALISHLLAQGKRVLITAHTDQALKEVRAKLPETIRDLSVSVVGSGREELAELRVAVTKLSQAAAEYSEEVADDRINRAQERIDGLRRSKAQTARQLLEAREAETLQVAHAAYEGTLAQIAAEHAEEADRLGWLASLTPIDADAAVPLNDDEALELLRLLRDHQLKADEPEAGQDLPEPEGLPSPDEFADQVHGESQASDFAARLERQRDHKAYESTAALDPITRGNLRLLIDGLAARADDLARRREAWMSEALSDLRSGKLHTWRSRRDQVSGLIASAQPLVDRLGPLVDVELTTSEPRRLLPDAAEVWGYLVAGGTVRIDPSTNKPKRTLLVSKVIKQAQAFFDQVRVDGLPPTTVDAIDTFTTWLETTSFLDALDRAWPATMVIPEEDTLVERLAWHKGELDVLEAVIALGLDLAAAEATLSELGVPKPDWHDLEGVKYFALLVDAADADEAHDTARDPLVALEQSLAEASNWDDAAPVIDQLRVAVGDRDPTRYRAGHRRLICLLDVREQLDRRDDLNTRLADACPPLASELARTPHDETWDGWLGRLTAAWQWAATATWIRQRNSIDINRLQASYSTIEDGLREQVAELAAVRAWSKAVHRLGRQQRADLMQYAQLVQSYGKTGGKYASRRRADMRSAMQRCRPAVPAWIMPVYRIAQALEIDADLFDVVVVDEASQAGLEATFLQYLAPKIVVIGDDKQNSPRAVGIDQSQLHGLAKQYLHDDRYRASWEDPKRSLFDEARMRFGDLIALTEHHRSVPDIIGFSNRIAYEPDGIRLIPIRQTGMDALAPIVPMLVEGGYTRGATNNKINSPEADAIVEQVGKCLADERYDGLTFGVISLTGAYQAKAIEKALMDRIDPREWRARDLRCGTAPDFQGSERNVMFLSMVAALDEDRRYAHAPLTADMYVQQFNVAASRAQDQMWVFHSVRSEELTNHDDMRYQLLDYCYSVSRRRTEHGEGHSTSSVPEDRPVPPFDSLFEQRVHNRIFDRGHLVIPQYEVGPLRIDLVVLGVNGKLAIECDGDHWHGPDRYEADLARQRDLERSGWCFFRVRESEFNIDPASALAPLWEMVEELNAPRTDEGPVTEQVGLGAPPSDEGEAATSDLATDAPAEVGGGPGGSSPSRVTPVSIRREQDTAPSAPRAAMTSSRSASGHREPQNAGVEPAPGMDGAASGAVPSTSVASEDGSRGAVDPWEDLGAVYATPHLYVAWDTSVTLPDAGQATAKEVQAGLLRIIEVEGPVLGQRLYQLYVRSTGGSRVGPAIKRRLNSVTHQLVGSGVVLADDPRGTGGQVLKTYRLPDQPAILVRELGDRTIHEVPPLELAARLRALSPHRATDEAAFRCVLDSYGLKRLSGPTRATLEQATELLDDLDF